MILLIHLLQHLGVPSGVAIGIVIAGRKFLKGVTGRTGARRDRGLDRSRDHR